MLHILKKSAFFIVIIIVVVLFLFFTRDKDSADSASELNAILSEENADQAQELDVPVDTTAIIDVKGQVNKPGVYEMDIESRVNEVIEKAGGFTKDADQTQVNLAQKVQDEMVIHIPKTGETAVQAPGEASDGSGKIRINQATQEEIETLNGIGPSKAEAIIQFREEHGLFKTPEDLLEISGIGEKTLENLLDDIQVP